MTDAEIVPICYRSAEQLRQQAIILGKVSEKFTKE